MGQRENRIQDMKPLRFQLLVIYDAFLEIAQDSTNQNILKHEASCLGKKISTFKFVCSTGSLNDVRLKINRASELHQIPKLDLFLYITIINKIIIYMKVYWLCGFIGVLMIAKEISEELEIG